MVAAIVTLLLCLPTHSVAESPYTPSLPNLVLAAHLSPVLTVLGSSCEKHALKQRRNGYASRSSKAIYKALSDGIPSILRSTCSLHSAISMVLPTTSRPVASSPSANAPTDHTTPTACA